MKLLINLSFAAALGAIPFAAAQDPTPPKGETPKETNLELTPEQQKEIKEMEEEQKKMMAEVESFGWIKDGKGDVGNNAELDVIPGFRLTKSASAAGKMIKFYGNPPSGRELAILAPEDLAWFSLFTFSADGYVKDDDKDKIDAEELLKGLREGQTEANKDRRAKGLSGLTIVDWAVKPFYNDTSKSLEYGLLLKDDGGDVNVNYKTVVLGRRGVMNVVLVCGQDQLNTALPELRERLKGFRYKTGETYAEYKKGDKIAEYTVGGLIAVGGLAVLAKTGILAKLGKFLIYIVVAVFALLAKCWNWIKGLFTGKKASQSYYPPQLPPQ